MSYYFYLFYYIVLYYIMFCYIMNDILLYLIAKGMDRSEVEEKLKQMKSQDIYTISFFAKFIELQVGGMYHYNHRNHRIEAALLVSIYLTNCRLNSRTQEHKVLPGSSYAIFIMIWEEWSLFIPHMGLKFL